MASNTYFKIYKDKSGEWRWTFKAKNGEPIAVSSEGYSYLTDCEHSVDLVKTESSSSSVIGDDNYDRLRR